MSRRNRRSGAAPQPQPSRKSRAARESRPFDRSEEDGFAFPRLGERLRRAALGLTVALVTMRVYWPSEPDIQNGAGSGLYWVLGLLVAAIAGLAGAFASGRPRPRWSWTDAAVVALVALVALSARNAADFRVASNLAWEWVGLGLAYLLVRNLPRTRGESSALAGALVASAVAVAVYGLYQSVVEMPELRALYRANPQRVLQMLGIPPDSPGGRLSLENRLLGSMEPWSTFALPNSLAGYIVGPLVLSLAVFWENLTRRDDQACNRPLGLSLVLGAPIVLALLACLVVTKSRSAEVGLIAALVVLAWRERRRVPRRTLLLAAGAGLVVMSVVTAVAWATRRFDSLVLTESFKSLRFRWEYWVGTWRLISQQPGVFWHGLGPGNFSWAYVRYKLPQASEEIFDPHDMFLEVWATAGLGAVIALSAALAFGFWTTFGPAWAAKPAPEGKREASPAPKRDWAEPPRRPLWIAACAGGALLFMMFWSMVIQFQVDLLSRWAVLGVAWVLAMLCGRPLWARRPIPAAGAGAGALAMAINLLAAGGIGIPVVALMLWMLLALGLNLRDDRPASRLREDGNRIAVFALGATWAAVMGLFYGTVLPYWKAERLIAQAESALRAKPPNYARARNALMAASDPKYGGDRYYAKPYLLLSAMELDAWKARGRLPNDKMYLAAAIAMRKAITPPRNPNVWSLQREAAVLERELLTVTKGALSPKQELRMRGDANLASRKATQLYPTNPNLRALLAETSADLSMFDDAVKEGEEALRLDGLTPHPDKKLPRDVREHLERQLPVWRKGVPAAG